MANDHFNRAELARLLELLKQAIKQHEEHGRLLEETYGVVLTIGSADTQE